MTTMSFQCGLITFVIVVDDHRRGNRARSRRRARTSQRKKVLALFTPKKRVLNLINRWLRMDDLLRSSLDEGKLRGDAVSANDSLCL